MLNLYKYNKLIMYVALGQIFPLVIHPFHSNLTLCTFSQDVDGMHHHHHHHHSILPLWSAEGLAEGLGDRGQLLPLPACRASVWDVNLSE